MKRISRKTVLRVTAAVLLAVLLTACMYRMNLASPRCAAEDLSPELLEREQRLVLLTGGRLFTDDEGRACCEYRFRWETPGAMLYFFYPPEEVLLNGESGVLREAEHGRICELTPDGTNGGEFELLLRAERGRFSPLGACVYFGAERHISAFFGVWTKASAYFQGMCFAVSLLSVVLLLFKHSERYLLWLALLAFFRGRYSRLRVLLSVVTWIPGFGFLSDRVVYAVLHELLAAYLQYRIMEYFVPVRFGKIPFIRIAVLGALPAFLLYRDPFAASVAELCFFAVLYLCYLLCFLRMPEKETAEKHLLLVSLILTAVLRFFDEFCEIGLFPSGDVNMRFRLRGLVCMIFVIAFFVMAGKIFAQKFREADELNLELENRIQEKTRQQTVFVRSMLHNLKTPLFSLSGYSDMAISAVERDPARARLYMEKAREKALFAGELIDHIFLVTQMDADMVHMNFAPVDVGALLRAVAETPTAGHENKRLRQELELLEEIYVRGDQLYLRQAFQNILDNARINTPEDGVIRIAARTGPDAAEIRISDTGCGIPPEECEKIFDAYYSNRHGGPRSSGLGLYISSEIVRRHGGAIRVESTVGVGSAFILTLPYSDAGGPNT